MTDAELRLWFHVRDRRLAGYRFRRQHPIGPYFADFACVERRLVVELDGGQHVAGYEADSRRNVSLERRGWRVIRFWNDEALKHPQLVLEAILLELNRPHPDPLPQAGEGITRPHPGALPQAGEASTETTRMALCSDPEGTGGHSVNTP